MVAEGEHGHGQIEPPRDGEGRADWDRFAGDVVAGHAPAWSTTGGLVRLGPTGIEVRVSVHSFGDAGASKSATLLFDVCGPAVGTPAVATFSGYGPTPLAAVVEGWCMWSQLFAPVLLAGYGGPAASATVADQPDLQGIEAFEITLEGRSHSVVVGSFGRAMRLEGDSEGLQARIDATRARLCAGAKALTEVMLAHSSLPTLAFDRATLLSIFVMDQASGRTTEVKVNGRDWPAAHDVFDERGAEPGGAMVLLRELAVVSPIRPSVDFLSRGALQQTLDGLSQRAGPAGSAESWPGWAVHEGRLALPTHPDPGLGDLPSEYITLLETVGVGGAGPGYGLEAPRVVDGVIPVAFAGCGCAWILRLDRGHRGAVWYDASGSDGTSGFVAPSATAWYELWLDAAVRSRSPWVQWDVLACAPLNVLGKLLQDPAHAERRQHRDLSGLIGRHAIAINGGGPYLCDSPQPCDPCQGCVSSFASWGLGPEIFSPGVLARRQRSGQNATAAPDKAPRRKWFRRN